MLSDMITMAQVSEFVGNNVFLFILLGVISMLLAWNIAASALFGGKQVGPIEATRLINREDALVLDVREPLEYAGGHILSAVNEPLSGLEKRLKDLEKHRSRPVVVSCKAGGDAAKAIKLLKKAGVEKVYRLKGGMFAWQNANLPVAKGKENKKGKT